MTVRRSVLYQVMRQSEEHPELGQSPQLVGNRHIVLQQIQQQILQAEFTV